MGEIVLRDLCGHASLTRIPLTLQVHPANCVRECYKRLEFKDLGPSSSQGAGQGAFIEIEWWDRLPMPDRR